MQSHGILHMYTDFCMLSNGTSSFHIWTTLRCFQKHINGKKTTSSPFLMYVVGINRTLLDCNECCGIKLLDGVGRCAGGSDAESILSLSWKMFKLFLIGYCTEYCAYNTCEYIHYAVNPTDCFIEWVEGFLSENMVRTV